MIVKIVSRFAAVALALATLASCDKPSTRRAEAAHGERAIALNVRVTDAANILTPDQEADLSAKSENLERKTGHQLVVVTVTSLGGQDVATFTRNLANQWGIGRKDYNDGVVLLVAPNERKARIEVGMGLEKVLPNERCQQVMDTAIIPHFRQGDMAGGIEAGVDSLIDRLR